MAEQMWGSGEVAEYLNLHRQTVTRLADRGELPGVKIGRKWRFRQEDIQTYFDEQIAGAKMNMIGRIPTMKQLELLGVDAGPVLDSVQTELEQVASWGVDAESRKRGRAALVRLEARRKEFFGE
jgi:excisionase family DNA binding protein